MIKDYYILLLFILASIILLVIYLYIDAKKTKNATNLHFKVLYNQISKEAILKKQYEKEIVKIDALEKNINQKLVNLKTDINTINNSLRDFFELI